MKIESVKTSILYTAEISLCLDEDSQQRDHLSLNTESECCEPFTKGYLLGLQKSLLTPKTLEDHKLFALEQGLSAIQDSEVIQIFDPSTILSEIGYNHPLAVSQRKCIFNNIARLGLADLSNGASK